MQKSIKIFFFGHTPVYTLQVVFVALSVSSVADINTPTEQENEGEKEKTLNKKDEKYRAAQFK